MSRRLLLLLALAALFAPACGGRSRARLSDVESASSIGGGTTVTRHRFRYNNDGTLDEVEREVNGQRERTTAFSYTDGRLDGVEITDSDGNRRELELVWQDGRLEEIEHTEADARWTQELRYLNDDPGRLEELRYTRELGFDTTLTVTQKLTWDDNRRLEELEDTRTTFVDIVDQSLTFITRSELRYADDGTIERVNVYSQSGSSSEVARLDYAYEDGALVEVEEDDGTRHKVEYGERGLIERVEKLGGGHSVVVDFEYEEGEVQGGVVLTPMGLPVDAQFDLTGRPFADFELLTLPYLMNPL